MRKLVICAAILFFGCNSPSHTSDDHPVVELSLEEAKHSQDKFLFPWLYSTYPVFSTSEISKKYYLKKLENFKGIPELDTFLLQTESFKTGNFSMTILSYDSTDSKKLNIYRDSLKMFDAQNSHNLNIVSGYKGNKQIIIADLNNNKDFSDDYVLSFPKDNIGSIKGDSVVEFKYHLKDSVSEKPLKRNIRIFPDSNGPFAWSLKDSLNRSLATSFEFMDFMKGQLKIDTLDYDVALQGFIKKRTIIIIKPTNVSLSDEDKIFNENFYYSVGDTLLLEDSYYKIDSLSENLRKLHFSKLDGLEEYQGRREGVNMKNYDLTTLTKDTATIKQFSEGKKFILLDFWGTWCVPCLELLPSLKKFHKENNDVSIISIALDESIDVVKDYANKKSMDWNHAYVDSNNRKGIIRDLRIKSYPTFILMDDDLKILYKGAGETALENIEAILKNSK